MSSDSDFCPAPSRTHSGPGISASFSCLILYLEGEVQKEKSAVGTVRGARFRRQPTVAPLSGANLQQPSS